jgi:hypothetical protein
MTGDMPPAWAELIKGLSLLAEGETNDISPLWCEHDTLHVCADPAKFTPEQLDLLADWGFLADTDGDPGFYSFRFGSA